MNISGAYSTITSANVGSNTSVIAPQFELQSSPSEIAVINVINAACAAKPESITVMEGEIYLSLHIGVALSVHHMK